VSTVEIEIDEARARALLVRVGSRLSDARPLMAGVANILAGSVEDVLNAEGKPRWRGLGELQKARRRERGTFPGKMLQDSGKLASSAQPSHGADFAQVATNDVRARTLHFGAQKGAFGRSKRGAPLPWGNIAARPWLVITSEARDDVRDAASRWYTGE
jgi:phage gpG-like protein